MKTEQRSLRLSRYYLSIVENVQEKNGFSFTDAIKHIITEYAKNQNNENSLSNFLQDVKKTLKNISPSTASEHMFDAQEIIDELNKLGNGIHLILKALAIIGSADPRTVVEIENLLGEDDN